MKHLKYYAHNSDFCLSLGNRIDKSSHVSIRLRGRNKNAKTANIRDITEQQIAVNSNASVNASRIIEIFVTNPDAMHGQRQLPAFSFDSASLACPRVDSLKTIMNALSFGLTLSLEPEHWLADCK